MSRMELIFWDATEMKMVENSIVISTETNQVHIVLPMRFTLPEMYIGSEVPEIQLFPEEEEVIYCNHRSEMHRLNGGCNGPDCICTSSRFDADECHERAIK